MNFVTLENVSKQYSERVLLENASLLINDGDRIGLIGPNGSGKTTLLRLLAGIEAWMPVRSPFGAMCASTFAPGPGVGPRIDGAGDRFSQRRAVDARAARL
ncbi:MAG: ABC-F family ATP-binding cassette domain-containing protein [Chloroflexi bacterium]|nr:ABC-F family ATP-binding cassette domain-containing protein [Chloroflexota bacterium]